MIAALYAFGDALLVLASFWFAHYARAHFFPALRVLYPAQFYLWIVPIILLIWIGVGFAVGMYREVRRQVRGESWRSILWDPLKVSLLSTLILFAFISAVKAEYISRLMIGLFAVTDPAAMILFRLVARQLRGTLRRTFGTAVNFLVVGCTPEALEIAREIEANQARGLKLAGFALAQARAPGSAGAEQPGLERRYPVYALAEMADLLRRHVIDEVIFAVSRDELEKLEETFLLCEEEGVRARVLVSFFPHVTSRVSLERLRDMPLLTFSTTPENEFLLLLKRIIDLGMALAFLVALSPVFLALAVAIKLTSRGPVFYRQIRCGLGGRRFTLYKFRSMRAGADQDREALLPLNELDGPAFKMRDDPRRTLAGRFMRRFSLDELPQLFNILKGDMSFVGPRPPLPEEVEHYERWQRRRLRMQPGLTCLWALEGRNQLNFRRWMELDLQYIDTWSPGLDWKILLKTIPVILTGRGAS